MVNVLEKQPCFMNDQDHLRTGGVAQAPRKMKENGVKNLKGAQTISEFHIGLPQRQKNAHRHFFMNSSGYNIILLYIGQFKDVWSFPYS